MPVESEGMYTPENQHGTKKNTPLEKEKHRPEPAISGFQPLVFGFFEG